MAHQSNARLLPAILASLAVGMVGLSYASVPLYRLFCQVTGYGGTTQAADLAPSAPIDRTITVRFDANVSQGLPWRFKPKSKPQTLKIGELGLAIYTARNLSDKPITGTATFNVTPQAAGLYFSKIECFCFVEQTLAPGEEVEMPVSYFIDPEIVDEKAIQNVEALTLSYTFFPKPEPDKAGDS